MKELEMIKAFAELEGITFSDSYTYPFGDVYLWAEIYDNGCYGWYNPITDVALNCAARDKYEATIEYGEHSDFISVDGGFYSEVMDRNVIPVAVIECILKSKGLWQ